VFVLGFDALGNDGQVQALTNAIMALEMALSWRSPGKSQRSLMISGW